MKKENYYNLPHIKEMISYATEFAYIVLLISIINSCQSKEGKPTDNSKHSEDIVNSYAGKWFPINKEGNKYYYCTDTDRFFEINKNKIYEHTPMEDSNFNIEHTKSKGNQTFFTLISKSLLTIF
ncbi:MULTISPECIES: hypothetical protein [unclassified Chryseobacterium]|uniref:hypothetical protein n=1 Tax=unclassified Chryseobacterium TaxID=2593645 RepID=UPI000F44981B|nr:hypothetical protein [Chryseobacterium sp. G0240]ROI03571.1 hypothetical protein EGI16_11415 [Chryseobacterium sp. G0240]